MGSPRNFQSFRKVLHGSCPRDLIWEEDSVSMDSVASLRCLVVAAEKESKGGLQEKLTMTVAVPYLWGVPPTAERLHRAVQIGEGIVDKVYRQWDFLAKF
ncbi:hypothetical protein Bca52824_056771 [Brassica carinata]|uniref:DUF7811 domain-containing protein n=1 Tax=Brassica carinata TaxID=52824 RepID=A0A8X7UE58_BRACI|nr:hypothetical protein Bca52824_056771 [Brassica carinata]